MSDATGPDSVPTPPGTLLRRHRDKGLHDAAAAADSDQAAQLSEAAIAAARAQGHQGETESDDPFVADLRRGWRWMRFSPAVERQFQADSRAEHWRRLIICTVIGHVAIWTSSINVPWLFPQMAMRTMLVWCGVSLMALVLTVGCVWLVPKDRARAWHLDLASWPAAFMTSCVLIWMSRTALTPVGALHSANIILVVMWACVLTRQRFWYAFALSVGTCLGGLLFLEGPTPAQQQIVWSNLKILAISTVFSLAANYLLEHRERRAYLLRKIDDRQRAELAQASEQLRQLSVRDPLTGIFNRRRFDADLASAWDEALHTRQSLALCMIDVDLFKAFNDTYGHPVGDSCLIQVAAALQKVAQDADGMVARLGGEEFAMLLPAHDTERAMAVAERARAAVQAMDIAHRASSVASHVTVSVGMVSAVLSDASSGSAAARALMLARADEALYQAKQAGRDRVRTQTFTPELASAPIALDESAPSALQPPAPSQANVLAQALEAKGSWVRLPPALEAQYIAAQVEERRTRLMWSSVAGLFLYNGYAWTNYDLMPDISHRLPMMQLVVTLFTLFVAALQWRRATSPHAREWLFTACITFSSLLTTWAFMPSKSITVFAGYVVLMLFPLFGAVASRLSFRNVLVTTWVAFAGAVIAAYGFGPRELAMQFDGTVILFTGMAFITLVSYALDRGERTDYLLRRIEQLQREALAETTAELGRLATLDPLTGVRNRRQFEADFERLLADARVGQQPLALLIADVDHFKAYNDGYGHLAGDGCLKKLATTFDELAISEGALAARLGGEEFGILIPRSALPRAERIGRRLCAAVSALSVEHCFSPVAPHVTVSVGVTVWMAGRDLDTRALLSLADEALYVAKSSGRNCVASQAQLSPTEPPRIRVVSS